MDHPSTSRSARRPGSFAASLATVVVAVVVLGACGGETALPAPLESAERGSVDTGGTGGDFCGVLRELAERQAGQEDPAEILESLAVAGDAAPKELRPAFAVLAGVAEQLQGLDEADADYFADTLEIVMDPAVQDAADSIDQYASDTCGVDLDEEDQLPDDPIVDDTIADSSMPEDSTPDVTISGAGGDIDLEHVDAILEKHKPVRWAEDLNFTTITMDTDVVVATGTATGLSVDDAMAACEALRSELVLINPEVTVEVRDGDTALASSSAGGKCAAT